MSNAKEPKKTQASKPTAAAGGAKLPTPAIEPLTMKSLAEILVKHYGLHNGKYDLVIEFKVGVHTFRDETMEDFPAMTVGTKKIGLVYHTEEQDGPFTVDAAIVNPR